MATASRPPLTDIEFDHTGIVVPDLQAAIELYTGALGCRLIGREADTDVDSAAIGLAGEHTRLRGAFLQTGGTVLELQEYLKPRGTGVRRPCDSGIGHVAFAVNDIDGAYQALQSMIRFNTPPRSITSGVLAGRRWVYGRDPWGVVIELCQHPDTNRLLP